MASWLERVFTFVGDRCRLCGRYGESGVVCGDCDRLCQPNTNCCRTCAARTPVPVERCGLCSGQRPERPPLVAPFDYCFPVDRILAVFKYHADLTLVPVLRHWLENVPADAIEGTAFVPVPLHPFRHRRRGFNQATLIARLLAQRYRRPVLDDAVIRRRHTAPQVGLTATERRRNLRDAFVVPTPLAHAHICIVDDVATTGATLQAVAASLQQSGVVSISAFCLAYAGAGVYR